MSLLIFLHSDDFFPLQVNPDMVPDFERAGLQFVGKDESGKRMGVGLEIFSDAVDLDVLSKKVIRNVLNHLVVLCWMQIIELPSHKFFIGAQFHPEFKSRPGKPSPLFLGNTTLLCKNTMSSFFWYPLC